MLVDCLDLAFVYPPGQHAERGELLQGYLIGQMQAVIVGYRVTDSLEVPGAELASALLTAPPGLRSAIAAEAETRMAIGGCIRAEGVVTAVHPPDPA